MRIFFAAAMIALAASAAPAPAESQTYYPWCAHYMPDGGTNCGFVSWEQCMQTARGAGAYCERNSFYTEPATVRRKKPRHG
jgi:hypothetical protein